MLQFNFFYCRGTSGIDIDLRRVDIDQCPQNYTTGVKQPMNIFAGTDKCKHRTTKVSFDQVHFAWNLCALVNLSSKHKKIERKLKVPSSWMHDFHGCLIENENFVKRKTSSNSWAQSSKLIFVDLEAKFCSKTRQHFPFNSKWVISPGKCYSSPQRRR